MDSQRFYMDSNLDSTKEIKIEDLTPNIKDVLDIYRISSVEEKVLIKRLISSENIF